MSRTETARHRADAAWPDKRRRIGLRPRWILATVLLLAFASILLVEAYVNSNFAPDNEAESGLTSEVPRSVQQGGPIIDTMHGQVRSYSMPPKTIALTFDDGPDPRWTPQVLRVLQRHHVTGTFFVVGSQVARYPGLVKQTARNGNELGIHTFTHPRLTGLSQWRRELQYSQTQMALAHAAGIASSLVRYPYSSEADAIDNENWKVIQEAGRLGYLTVLTDTDSKDWATPGVDKIVTNSIPDGDDGAIVLFHDAGGDRSQTIAGLDRFIPLMQSMGYRFVTVSEGLNMVLNAGGDAAAAQSPSLRANTPASKLDERRGWALVWTVRVADGLLRLLWYLFIVVGALTLCRTLLLFVLARKHARRRRKADWSWGPPVDEPVSVVVPAYNEKEGIVPAVRSLAGGDYPPGIEVVVVDDGSTDGTADLAESLRLPNVRVFRVPNGGKPVALNIGTAWARHDIVVMVDGDTIVEPDSIRTLVQPFADPRVGAVAGNVKVGNRGSLVARWQHIEYVVGFSLDRRLYDEMQVMPTVPGALGAFRRSALRDVGWVSDETLAEDTDLTMALLRAGWRVVYEEKARAWTEAPSTLGQLWRQRYRWSYGTMQAMWKHRRALRDSGASGRFGRVGLPFLALFGIALPMLAPLIDVMAVYGLFFFDRAETAIGWLAMLGLQLITAVVAFRLDKEQLRALWALPLQQFVYRQMMYLVLIQSVVTAVTGARLRWHKLKRTGQAPALR